MIRNKGIQMKTTLLALCLLVVVSFSGAGSAVTGTPEDVIKATAEQVLDRIRADRDGIGSDPVRLLQLVDEKVVPHFDWPRMSQWVLGSSWKGADIELKKRFIIEFKNLLVRTYATALLEYSDQSITYIPVGNADPTELVTVKTEINQPGSVATPINYKMHAKDGEWKVFDVSVDGVSLIATDRASFASEIRQNGLEALINNLAARASAP